MTKLRTCIAEGCNKVFESADAGDRVCPACRPEWERVARAWHGDRPPPLTWDPDDYVEFADDDDDVWFEDYEAEDELLDLVDEMEVDDEA